MGRADRGRRLPHELHPDDRSGGDAQCGCGDDADGGVVIVRQRDRWLQSHTIPAMSGQFVLRSRCSTMVSNTNRSMLTNDIHIGRAAFYIVRRCHDGNRCYRHHCFRCVTSKHGAVMVRRDDISRHGCNGGAVVSASGAQPTAINDAAFWERRQPSASALNGICAVCSTGRVR